MSKIKSLKPVLAGSVRAASLNGVSALTLALAVSGSASAQAVTIDDRVNSGEVTVPGDYPSPWEVDGSIYVGNEGTGTLTIENGGTIDQTSAFTSFIGYAAGSEGTVTVSGTDADGNASTWNTDASLTVGGRGTGTLLVEGGGVITGGAGGTVGASAGGVGTVTITGTDGQGSASHWNVGDSGLAVGREGEGTLHILDGGLVTSQSGNIAGRSGAQGKGTVIVSGVNADGTASTWNAEGSSMAVGANGEGVLRIEAGGIVKNFAGIIARTAGIASEATVTGTGSHWINGAGLTVGEQGDGTLTVTDGGLVTASGVSAGWGDDSFGTILVSGVDSAGNASTLETTNSSISIGNWSSGAMTVEGGGQVNSARFGYIAANRGTTGTVLISGTDGNGKASAWHSNDNLEVGAQGNGTLTILDGGAATAGARIFIGDSATATGNAIVSGTDAAGNGSSLSSEDRITIGNRGVGNLTVTDGGIASGREGYIASFEGSFGTLNIGASENVGPAAAGVFDVATLQFRDGNGTLVFNHTDEDYLFSTALSSEGNGTHRILHHAGHTTLTGDSSGFTGTTTLYGGTLLLVGGLDGAGSLGGTIDVLDAARLGGTGVAGSLVSVASGGILAPGNSIGTLTVAGDVTFASGSIFEVEIIGGGNTPGIHNDLLAVSGVATLESGTVQVVTLDPETSYQQWQDYIILTADGGVTGEFLEAVSESAFITTQLTHNPDHVILGVGLVNAPEPEPEPEPEPGPEPEPEPEPTPGLFPTAAGTYNQTQAAIGLDDLDQASGSDALAVYNRILMLSESAARQAFDLSSGEIHASGRHVIDRSSSLFGRTLRRQGTAGLHRNGRVSAAPPACGLRSGAADPVTVDEARACADARVANAWLAPLGERGTIDGDGNAAELDWWNAGIAGGYEGSLDVDSGNAFAGFGLGYIRSHGRVDERLSSLDADGFHVGAYGAWEDGPWSLAGSLAYAANRVSTRRNIVFGGIDRTAEARYWTHTLDLSGEAAYGFDIGMSTILSPLVTLDAGWSRHGGFTETGAGALDLTGDAESWARFDTGIGIALEHSMPTDTGTLTLRGRAVWEHAFADVIPSQSLALAGSPTGFEVLGPDAGRDRFRLGAGLTWNVADGIAVRADYEGLFSGNQSSHGGSIGLNVRF